MNIQSVLYLNACMALHIAFYKYWPNHLLYVLFLTLFIIIQSCVDTRALLCTAVVLSCTVLYCTALYCSPVIPAQNYNFPINYVRGVLSARGPPAATISLANAAVNCSFRRCYPILFPHDTSISRQTETHLFPRAGHVSATCRPGGRIISVSSDVFVGTSLKPNSS